MGLAAPVLPPPPQPQAPPPSPRRHPELRLEGRLIQPESLVRSRSATLGLSLSVHTLLAALVLTVPLLYYDELVSVRDEGVRAFFATPVEMLPPPPPPPPPAPSARRTSRAKPAPRPQTTAQFAAPIEIPEEIVPEEGLDLGVEGGVAGGVEGGVPGGVVGGIVGGLPTDAPPPAPVVRVGGMLKPPRLLQRVAPEYPTLARQARMTGVVIIEAHVGTDGSVRTARILRGLPLLDEAALDAVKQWRYAPLLLNGVPTEFILTVVVNFALDGA